MTDTQFLAFSLFLVGGVCFFLMYICGCWSRMLSWLHLSAEPAGWNEFLSGLIPEQIAFLDGGRKYVFCTPEYAARFQMRPAQIIGKFAYDVFGANAYEKIIPYLDTAYAGQKSVYEEIVRDDNEKYIVFSTEFIPRRDRKGRIIGVSSVTRDVTGVKNIERSLKNELAYNEYVFKRNPAMIIGFDMLGNILSVNPKVCEVTEYREEELIGKNWWLLFFPGQEQENFDRLVRTFKVQWELNDYEMPLITKSGHKKIISWTSLNRYDENVEVKEIIGFGIDVTEKRNYQRKLLSEKEEAEEANRTKSSFLANMSHEIRTPLNGIIGSIQLLAETKLTQKQSRYLQIIQSSGRNLLTIINEILDYSKIEAGKFEIHLEPFELRPCIEETIGLMQPLAHEKGIDILLEYDPCLSPRYCGDGPRVRQILINLIGNAIKFTDKGSVRVHVNLSKEFDDLVLFDVIDTGIGIPADKLESLFTPFSQIARKKDSARSSGTGLGLAISRYLAENMGGEIDVESQEGKGSRFLFSIQFEPVGEMDVSDAEEILQDRESLILDILVVEDVLTNQFVITEMLERLGCTVDVAGNGKEAVQILQEKKYDLVLMDCQMPVMDGFEATQAIRKLGMKELPIVALTANALVGDREKCLAAGMDDFISKPIEKRDLMRVCLKYVSEKRKEEEAV